MPISKRTIRRIRWRRFGRAVEALALALVFAVLPELPRVNGGAVLDPHPGWIAVLVLAARYGGPGLFTGLFAAACGIGLGSVIAGAGLAASWGGLESAPNLLALGACLLVSCVTSGHFRRQADLRERLREASRQAADAEATADRLRNVVEALRARVDRASTSLSFLRDVAKRLEGTDPVAAAEAAADLALVRTGASVVAVRAEIGELQRYVTVRDPRGPDSVNAPRLHNPELSVPILAGNDRIGVIALWGVSPSALDEAASHDLDVIASWCGPALLTAACQPEPAAAFPAREAT